ncbi:MAG: lipopolysaccharide heptosyltransferase II [Nitrospirota bacterium]
MSENKMDKRDIRRDIRKILIRGTNWIGDTVMTTPALRAIKEYFPDARISILVRPLIGELLREFPYLDNILIYDNLNTHRGLSGKLRLIQEIKRERFDMAILLQNAFDAAFITFFAGIPIRYGYDTDGRGIMLNHRVAIKKNILRRHQIEYYLHLLSNLGIGHIRDHAPSLYLSKEEERSAERFLLEHNLNKGDFIAGINPGATYGTAKRWFPERYAMLADKIINGFNAKVLIFGGPDEAKLAEEISETMSALPIILSGRMSLRESMALIKRCSLFITNDSGLMHIASSFKIPVIAIFGSTDPKTTSPYGDSNMLIKKEISCSPCLLRDCSTDHRCMDAISVDEVYKAVEREVESIEDGKKKAIALFVDRDGTINRDVGYLDSIDKLEIFPGVSRAVRMINERNIKVIVVTNQSGVARGLFSENDLKRLNILIKERLEEEGASLDAIYYCPHHPEIGNGDYKKRCNCRKPSTGMLKRAASDFNIDISNSYMIGDKITDIELANNAGAKAILVLTGYGRQHLSLINKSEIKMPVYIAKDLSDAVEWIIKDFSV